MEIQSLTCQPFGRRVEKELIVLLKECFPIYTILKHLETINCCFLQSVTRLSTFAHFKPAIMDPYAKELLTPNHHQLILRVII